MEGVNTWWEGMLSERYWLGIAGRDNNGAVLAAPCADSPSATGLEHRLIRCVKDGDVVFHYDESQQAIVAWSTPRGRVRKQGFSWSEGAPGASSGSRRHPAWSIGLEGSTLLDDIVPLDQIARIQWDLFPALRAFEDMVGAPLYYPFAMGSPSGTRLLDGYVFKLPMLFVECFPSMSRIVEHVGSSAAAGTGRVQGEATFRCPARDPRAPLALVDRVRPDHWDVVHPRAEPRRRAQ